MDKSDWVGEEIRNTSAWAWRGRRHCDLTRPLTVPVIVQYIQLRQQLEGIVLSPASQDYLLSK
jgi:hypothetical protein